MITNRKSQKELNIVLTEAAELVKVGAIYKHYKQLEYRVITIALQEETGEPYVIYRAEYDKGLVWSRPLSN